MDLRPLSARELSLAAALALGACGDNLQPYTDPPSIDVVSMPALPWPEVDILVVVDDSANTSSFQVSLADGFDTLLDRLEAAAGARFGGHVGVATSDLGATSLRDLDRPGATVGACTGRGDDGLLRTSGAPVSAGYLAFSNDVYKRNYTGDRHAAISTMLHVGSNGCDFAQPLAASVRAFGNPANAGFHVPTSNLLVLIVTNEDDCSASDPALFSLGGAFRCTHEGLVCDEDLDSPGAKHGCRARIDSPSVENVAYHAAQLRKLVSDPSRLTVAVIAGVPSPVILEDQRPPGGGPSALGLASSCEGPTMVTGAVPPVRLRDLTEQVGAHGALASICPGNLRPPLDKVARVANQMFGVACLDPSRLRDTSTEDGIQPACTATLVRDGVETELPQCPAEGDCFDLVPDLVACPIPGERMRFSVNHVRPPTQTTFVRARCEVP